MGKKALLYIASKRASWRETIREPPIQMQKYSVVGTTYRYVSFARCPHLQSTKSSADL
jgi:hypothetical protein